MRAAASFMAVSASRSCAALSVRVPPSRLHATAASPSSTRRTPIPRRGSMLASSRAHRTVSTEMEIGRRRRYRLFRGHRPETAVAGALRGGDPARSGDLGEDRGPVGRRALVRLVVDPVQAEARHEAEHPFEVVHQAPMVVAAYVDAVVERMLDLLERAHDVLGAPRARLGGETRFADGQR